MPESEEEPRFGVFRNLLSFLIHLAVQSNKTKFYYFNELGWEEDECLFSMLLSQEECFLRRKKRK